MKNKVTKQYVDRNTKGLQLTGCDVEVTKESAKGMEGYIEKIERSQQKNKADK